MRSMRLDPHVTDALERAYEAGRSLLARGVDLLAPRTRLFLCDGRMLGIGILVAFSGWIFLMLGLIDGLAERYPRFAVELAVGLAHGGAATLLIVRGGRRAARTREPEVGVRLQLVRREPGPQGKELAASAPAQARKPKVEEPEPPGESAVEWMLANASAAVLGATALAMLIARLVRSGR